MRTTSPVASATVSSESWNSAGARMSDSSTSTVPKPMVLSAMESPTATAVVLSSPPEAVTAAASTSASMAARLCASTATAEACTTLSISRAVVEPWIELAEIAPPPEAPKAPPPPTETEAATARTIASIVAFWKASTETPPATAETGAASVPVDRIAASTIASIWLRAMEAAMAKLSDLPEPRFSDTDAEAASTSARIAAMSAAETVIEPSLERSSPASTTLATAPEATRFRVTIGATEIAFSSSDEPMEIELTITVFSTSAVIEPALAAVTDSASSATAEPPSTAA